ncbi:MAG: murein transglycosylase [Rhodobacteraceae bacterium]|nr:murein transglycosylase [Paracoccaceae bacterium]MBR9821268.1 murein transglycosylase [Paracoccaceae bacterium]
MVRRGSRSAIAACLALALLAPPGQAQSTPEAPTISVLGFDDLTGWAADDHAAALATFRVTCGDLRDPDWTAICAMAKAQPLESARTFFELVFTPVLIQDGTPALFTGYYEPELNGSRSRTETYRYPVYRMPLEAQTNRPWLTRAQIDEGSGIAGRGLEIAWVDDPVELMFLQIQGSGRILLPDGSHIRIGYRGDNGHPYSSIGQEMVRRGIYKAHQVSAKVISNWVRRNPVAGAALLRHNASYVFFREITDVSPEAGPKGAMNRSLTPTRSVAIDPRFVPLGAPVWIEKKGFRGMRRLMVGQDTGSAIKGPQRADVFMGSGPGAGKEAAKIKDGGRLVVLLPIQRAYAMLVEDPA